ncbi:hypothetical protein EYR40_002553 [Pleurotus pulmonarius]|nr:hypothetical protein EYR40_002553 [Pleurotus pulmonarius]
MVRDHSSTGNSVVVEHSIEIPPSAHGHRVQVSSSPKKHVVTVERCDLLKIPTRAEEDEQLITARLSALNLYARPNGLPSTSPCNRTSTPDVFVTAEPSPAHFAHPRLTPGPVGATQEVDDDTSIDGTPVDEDYIPVHLRWVGGCRDRASYAVPRDIQALYPADSTDRRGWKEQKYYVVVPMPPKRKRAIVVSASEGSRDDRQSSPEPVNDVVRFIHRAPSGRINQSLRIRQREAEAATNERNRNDDLASDVPEDYIRDPSTADFADEDNAVPPLDTHRDRDTDSEIDNGNDFVCPCLCT